MDDERFILEVQKHTVLYDTRNPFYKDNAKKEKAWSLIAEVVGVEVDVCRARWKTLRDAFVKNRSKKNLPSGSAGGTQKEWKYSEMMSFLLPHLKPRSSKSNLTLQTAWMNMDHSESSASPSLCTDERSSTPGLALQRSTSVSPPPSLNVAANSEDWERPSRSCSPMERMSTVVVERASNEKRRSQRPQTTDIGDRLMSLLQEPIPKPHMPDAELDESYHFALSLVPMLHRLDKDRRQQAKIQILNTLHRVEKGQTLQTFPPQHSVHPPTYTPTQEILGQSTHSSRPSVFRTNTLPSQQGTPWEDDSTYGSYY